MKNKFPFIGVAGNIGVGKTTFTRVIAEQLRLNPYYESVADNPYLADFYGDMKRWSFNLQIYFLHHRFRMQSQIAHEKGGAIQDRTIYEDVEIFARNLYLMGHMDERDWTNYENLFSLMTSYLRRPDLIVYLRATTETIIERIQRRNRSYETHIDPAYLKQLNAAYDQWIRNVTDIPILEIDTNNFNIYSDHDRVAEIVRKMEDLLGS